STPLRMFADMQVYPGESEISAALKRLLSKPATIGILSGNDERSARRTGDSGYQSIMTSVSSRGALISQGFDVLDLAIDSVERIPDSLSVLVIADPMGAYSAEQLSKINSYISNGGNILIAGEPGKQHLLNPLLEQFGVSLADGTLLQKSEGLELDLIQSHSTKNASEYGFDLPAKWIISMPGAVAVNYGDNAAYKAEPILLANIPKAWIKKGTFNLETDSVVFDPATETQLEAPVAVTLTKKFPEKEQKIMVVGDADFMSNGELSRFNITTANTDFVVQLFKWFSDGEYPINTTRPDSIDNKI